MRLQKLFLIIHSRLDLYVTLNNLNQKTLAKVQEINITVLQQSFDDLRSSKIFGQRSIFVFVLGTFQIVEEATKLQRF